MTLRGCAAAGCRVRTIIVALCDAPRHYKVIDFVADIGSEETARYSAQIGIRFDRRASCDDVSDTRRRVHGAARGGVGAPLALWVLLRRRHLQALEL
jgi:hypothetical protein